MYCKLFEDNYGGIDITCVMKICPRNKHINDVFHHFLEYVCKVLMHIQQVSTGDQCNDAWTKLFPHNVLLKHQNMIFGF